MQAIGEMQLYFKLRLICLKKSVHGECLPWVVAHFFNDISVNSILSGSTFMSSTVSGNVLMPSSFAVFSH